MKKLWFKNKRYGYGWTPASWEGFLILFVYLVCLTGGIFFINTGMSPKHMSIYTAPYILILTALLIVICAYTGEKPEWRWGDKKK